MAQLLRWCNRIVVAHPWKTQLLTTGFLMATSDVIAQTAIEKKEVKDIEPLRVGRFAFLGSCFVAPILRTWYNVLEKTMGAVGRTVGLRKMMVDQLLFTPCFLGCFLTVSGALQFQPWSVIKDKINKEYFEVLKTNYMLWPSAQLITFYVIPLQYRIIFVSFVALLWNTYLASQANQSYNETKIKNFNN
ncbi:protein Mpv17 [Trichonephila clavata]|uniref:Mitochondrial inner membrane protein Mpv17 n=1 Tax=Trichonephila clavata TaxID=2740835 RepID=A0A8X6IPU1_TRICU|nr:protein Mpv17 [Trichonephila clavata]